MQDRYRQLDEILLRRTAGPYIRVIRVIFSDPPNSLDVRYAQLAIKIGRGEHVRTTDMAGRTARVMTGLANRAPPVAAPSFEVHVHSAPAGTSVKRAETPSGAR